MMRIGDLVRVYPHGAPQDACTATVLLFSENGRAIAIVFSDMPRFRIGGDGIMIHRATGQALMLASREFTTDGRPCGPWVEVKNGGHYEIEEMKE
jgi:hypothetical protein